MTTTLNQSVGVWLRDTNGNDVTLATLIAILTDLQTGPQSVPLSAQVAANDQTLNLNWTSTDATP